MKKLFLLTPFVLIICFLLSSCKTFDSYYYNLEDSRNEEYAEYYENADYIFTQDSEDVVVDFIIEKNLLHIVQIKVKNKTSTAKYRVRSVSSHLIESAINNFEQYDDYHWQNNSKLSYKSISWCIVSKEFNDKNDNLPAFDFIYNNTYYSLCYNMSDGE